MIRLIAFIFIAQFTALVFCRPLEPDKQPVILKNELNNDGIGEYNFDVKTSDGFERSEKGGLKNVGTPEEALSVEGHYSYIGPDGVTYTVFYIADENGFQPEGEHLPSAGGNVLPSTGTIPGGEEFIIPIIAPGALASLAGGGLG